MPGPFTDYVSQKYLPGSADDSPAYFMRESLGPAGWSPEATDWAIKNVPTGFSADANLFENNPDFVGFYNRPTGDAQVRIGTDRSASDVADTTRHELQHAWDRQRGPGYFPTGDEAQAALAEIPDAPWSAGNYATIKSLIDKDPSHGTNDLFEVFGLGNVQRLPQAFRTKFFGNLS